MRKQTRAREDKAAGLSPDELHAQHFQCIYFYQSCIVWREALYDTHECLCFQITLVVRIKGPPPYNGDSEVKIKLPLLTL